MGRQQFDLICLFSVFTHLAPHDYVAMLRLLRRHATPDARLIFSLFVRDPEIDAAYGEAIEKALSSPDPEVRRRTQAALEEGIDRRAAHRGARFVDEVPGEPAQDRAVRARLCARASG
jgi:hypothetical protein